MPQAVQDLRSTDLSMWASRYNLFVLWSADQQHPWDGLSDAQKIAATLEIGKAEQEEKVRALTPLPSCLRDDKTVCMKCDFYKCCEDV